MIARAMATRCFCPPEMRAARSPGWVSYPATKSKGIIWWLFSPWFLLMFKKSPMHLDLLLPSSKLTQTLKKVGKLLQSICWATLPTLGVGSTFHLAFLAMPRIPRMRWTSFQFKHLGNLKINTRLSLFFFSWMISFNFGMQIWAMTLWHEHFMTYADLQQPKILVKINGNQLLRHQPVNNVALSHRCRSLWANWR